MPDQPSFRGLGIAPNILTVLDKLRFIEPTPIQQQSIPQALEGKDMMGIAQTGTGKTLAFGIPLIQNILKDASRRRALILLPTRELAVQVDEVLRKIGGPLGIKTAVLIGGESIRRQWQMLDRKPQVVVATPGRLIDHLEQKTVSLKEVSVVVLDEADRMLDMGFAPQLKRILAVLPRERQTMLFSATMPETIVAMARAYLKLPIRIEVARSGTAAKDVTQEVFIVTQPEKPRLLEKILQEYRGSVLVFSRTKFAAKKVAAHLRVLGHTAVEFHSNRSQNQRQEALDGFKNGKYRVIVATDIAARGIDVKNIELVLNYDLPTVAEDYIHRIGRTGRAGEKGHAISFARPDQKGDVQAIERLMRATLPVSQLPTLPPPMPGTQQPFERAERRPFAPRGARTPYGSHGARPSFSAYGHPRAPQGSQSSHGPHGPGARRSPYGGRPQRFGPPRRRG
jgi:ATP-dependent RNA helicase RhlE